MPTSPKPAALRITGTVYDAFDAPLPGLRVQALHNNLRAEVGLGTATADTQGHYTIPLKRPDGNKTGALNVLVRVTDRRGKVLAEAPVQYKLVADAVINVKVGGGAVRARNEYDALFERVQVVLKEGRLKLGELSEEKGDIAHVAALVQAPVERIKHLVQAHADAKGTGLEPAIHYALLRTAAGGEVGNSVHWPARHVRKVLRDAIAGNIISRRFEAELDKVIAAYDEASVRDALRAGTATRKLLDLTLTPAQQQEFLAVLTTHEDKPAAFWDALKKRPAFRNAKLLAKTQELLEIHASTSGCVELTGHLVAQRTSASVAEFAKYDRADWATAIKKARVAKVPDQYDNGNAEESKQRYAEALYRTYALQYPGAHFAYRIAREAAATFKSGGALQKFLLANPGLDLRAKNIEAELESADFGSNNPANKANLKEDVRALHRLQKLVPEASGAIALHAKGIRSAGQLVKDFGKETFVTALAAALGGAAPARAVYGAAASVSNKSLAVAVAASTSQDISMRVMESTSSAAYHEMFSDFSLCACEHCTSVYSPAAYLVDVLAFIQEHSERGEDGHYSGPYGELMNRRPDLAHILLTCTNTNTVLPYIDLVNEILQREVVRIAGLSGGRIPDPASSFQTVGESAMLLARPEYEIPEALAEIGKSDAAIARIYALPYAPYLDELRAYISKLGTTRAEVMATLASPGTNDVSIAAEELGLSRAVMEAIANEVTWPFTTLPTTVQAVLDALRIGYEDLLRLLQLDHLNPIAVGDERTVWIDDTIPVEGQEEELVTCDLNKMTVMGHDEPWMRSVARSIRLWKTLKWDLVDLDHCITALDLEFGTDVEGFLQGMVLPLQRVQVIAQRLKLSVQEAVAFVAAMDVRNRLDAVTGKTIPSLFTKVFGSEGSALIGSNVQVQKSMICAALRITDQEFMLLQPVDDTVSVQSLARLWRKATLMKALRLEAEVYVAMMELIAPRPDAEGVWASHELLAALEEVDLLQRSRADVRNFFACFDEKIGSHATLPVTTQEDKGMLAVAPRLFLDLKFALPEVKWLHRRKDELGITEAFAVLGEDEVRTDERARDQYTAYSKVFRLDRIKGALGEVWMSVVDNALDDAGKSNWMDLVQGALTTTGAYLSLLCGDPTNPDDPGRMGLRYPEDLREPEQLLRVLEAMRLMHTLGCNNDQLRAITDAEPEPSSTSYAATMSVRVTQLAALVRAKFSETQWLEIEKAVQDGVRVRRRDALVAWVLARNGTGWRTTNDLHAALLIDVEMSACTMTSRIKQAISSVQLFVDRCLMGLETENLSKDFADQWNRWRKQYRVWEANRKVFLYPENWIEPDLRKDKSPFFQELEAEIGQSDLTDELAEKALITYLEKMDAVANLEIVALHEDKASKKLHVIGRTRNHPHRYFYRYRQLKVWSAWEKLDVDVEGDHLLLTVWNGRMLLFWGQFTEKQYTGGKTTLKGSSSEMSLTSDEPKTYVEMKLAWSEYASGRWGAKKMSKEACALKGIVVLPVPQGQIPFLGTDVTESVSREEVFLASDSTAGQLSLRILQRDSGSPTTLHQRWLYIFDNCNGEPRRLDIRVANYLTAIEDVVNNVIQFGRTGSIVVFGRSPLTSSTSASRQTLLANASAEFSISPAREGLGSKGGTPLYQTGDSSTFLVESISFSDTIGEHVLDYDGMDTQVATRSSRGPISAPSEETSSGGRGTMLARRAQADVNTSDRLYGGLVETVSSAPGGRRLRKVTFTYRTHFHPHTCSFLNAIRSGGLDALYEPTKQSASVDDFATTFQPTEVVATPYPVKNVDFSYQGAYAQYNWELFFHIPLLIATRLQADKKFAEARRWYHRIFDPTRSVESGAGAERFWITKPFKEAIQLDLANLQELLTEPSRRDELNAQLAVWETHPFDPHALARLRHTAYMRTTVLKYIDNLIEWGDQLFRRDTIESINEATLLYILAANILGDRQENIHSTKRPKAVSFDTVDEVLDPFNNFLAAVEGYIDPPEEGADPIRMQGFCLPGNPDILRYWDTVADRLFKVRHCMNIDGVVRQLPLFEPPIDPGLLVRATNQGLSLDQILSGQDVSLPHYRFRVMLQRANELCNEVRSLGGMLLSTLEKKDAEELSLLRSTHELRMLDLMRDIKVRQRDEAKEQLKAVMASRKAAEHREEFYTSREYRNSSEKFYFWSMETAHVLQGLAQLHSMGAGFLSLLPDVKLGSPFSVGVTQGGSTFSHNAEAFSTGFNSLISGFRTVAEMANMKAHFQRRDQDWQFQAESARREIAQIDKQITAAEIRLAIAEKELENHAVQMEQSAEVDAYMRGKFTNQELYHWMAGSLSDLYFQTYNMALRAAKQAEQCMLHELPDASGGIIRADQWDGLKKGLMSGEKLQYDLRRLESEYTDRDARDLEMTKHISMAQLDPFALIKLRETGTCEFDIPEVLYDLDFPGHYRRRIRSVSISIPCVAGPYTSVSATLTQVNSRYRKTGDPSSEFQETAFAATPSRAIATSHGQNDAGLFELNFRDERYLPFEGTGAIGRWKLELPEVARQFDYGTISDMLLHVRYTARSSDVLKAKVNEALRAGQEALVRSFALPDEGPGVAVNLRRDMPNEWHRLKREGSVQLAFGRERLPYVLNSLPSASLGEVVFIARGELGSTGLQLTVASNTRVVPMTPLGSEGESTLRLGRSSSIGLAQPFTISLEPSSLPELEDLVLVLKYAFPPMT